MPFFQGNWWLSQAQFCWNERHLSRIERPFARLTHGSRSEDAADLRVATLSRRSGAVCGDEGGGDRGYPVTWAPSTELSKPESVIHWGAGR